MAKRKQPGGNRPKVSLRKAVDLLNAVAMRSNLPGHYRIEWSEKPSDAMKNGTFASINARVYHRTENDPDTTTYPLGQEFDAVEHVYAGIISTVKLLPGLDDYIEFEKAMAAASRLRDYFAESENETLKLLGDALKREKKS